MNAIIKIHPIERGAPGKDNCGDCSKKICCHVYDITVSEDQGRKSTVVKKGGEACQYFGEEGKCTVYDNRGKLSGYREHCGIYSCNNMGPLLSEWIENNSIDIQKESMQIGWILSHMQWFIENYQNDHDSDPYDIIKSRLQENTTTESLLYIFRKKSSPPQISKIQYWLRKIGRGKNSR